MAPSTTGSLWKFVREQHGVVSHEQLVALGYSPAAIKHRQRTGRLHARARGVYAVGRPDLSWSGTLIVGVLACGPGALVSHGTAASLWQVRPRVTGPIEITVSSERSRRRPGLRVHCRTGLELTDAGRVDCIPVTAPSRTIVDIASSLSRAQLERSINLADSLDLIDPEALRDECERFAGQAGVHQLRRVLDRRTFRVTESRLEQRFLAIVARTALPLPLTQRQLDGFRTDFV